MRKLAGVEAGGLESWKRLCRPLECIEKSAKPGELPQQRKNRTPFALVLRLLVTSLRRYEAFRRQLGAKLSPAGLP